MTEYEPVIGLEIHAELNTKTKMFCDSLNDPDEKHPNINICPVCMGHPGTLPVINQEAVKKVIQVGLALGGEISEFSQFDRKNYFYPDLPKGYQISQYQHPLVNGGYVDIEIPNHKFQITNKSQIPNTNDQKINKRIRIRRVHLEEDTGRLLHDLASGDSLVDYNRAGRPLMELVTEPDLSSGEEVRIFGETLQKIFRFVGASNTDMEKGEMRVEVNISLRKKSEEKFGVKVELKNINSFKFAEDAVKAEIKRQAAILNEGGEIKQETWGWDEKAGRLFLQRSKEESHDYRYFPEPDLPPLNISRELVEELRAALSELPAEKKRRFVEEYGLNSDLAGIITDEKDYAAYFEKAISELEEWTRSSGKIDGKSRPVLVKLAANYFTSDFLNLLNQSGSSAAEVLITPENFAELIKYLSEGKISSAVGKSVLKEMFASGGDPSVIIEEKGLWQIQDNSQIETVCDKILAENPKVVEDIKNGKTNAVQFLIGQAMAALKGKADPMVLKSIFENKINKV